MRKMNELDWQRCVNAANPNNYIPYDMEAEESGLLIEMTTPHDILEKKEHCEILQNAYRAMSAEARQIISIIIESPMDLQEIFMTPTGKLAKGTSCRSRLQTFLSQQWKDLKMAKKIVREIQEFVRLF